MTDDPRAVMAAFLRRSTQTDDLNMPLPEAQITTEALLERIQSEHGESEHGSDYRFLVEMVELHPGLARAKAADASSRETA